MCAGPGVALGQLGNLRWFRCRDCGMDFSKVVRRKPKRAPLPSLHLPAISSL
jgi:hypothetical protein